MGVKDEIKQAKEHAIYMRDKGLPLDEIMKSLNMTFDGFYHIVRGQIVRDQDKDYLPATVII